MKGWTTRGRCIFAAMMLTAPTLATGMMTSPAHALPAEASTGLKRPLDVTLKVSGWCDNTGSDIDIVGDLTLGSVGLRVTLANNRKGTHSVEVTTTTDITVLSAEDHAVFQKAPAFGGIGGNPHAVLELRDSESGDVLTNDAGDPLTYYLGRCVTGARGSSAPFSANIAEQLGIDGGLDSLIQALSCSQKGSDLSIRGSGFNDGVDAHVILANQVNKQPGEPGVHYADVVADASVNLLGATQRHKGWWDKEAGIHGPGGNPLVYRLTDSGALSAWEAKVEASWGTGLGRCNKLT
jgi:hypothetical protein